jgi:DNA anti-recombination protein RmuC
MKLNELAAVNPTKQAAKVFESYFGKGVDFDAMPAQQARVMLRRVRTLIAEHRRTPEFHSSEQNPAYLKLVVMEQALSTVATATTPQATPQQNPQQTAAAMTLQRQQQQRNIDDQLKQVDQQIRDLTAQKATLQKQKMQPAMERRLSLKQRLKEASEVQQAQVVLASQDMVDQVQKMSEQISAMQFKDLPALVDQIKNEVGTDQAMQFNTDATAALAGLLQNLQGAKTQLEAALGVVTGQAPVVPGTDMTGGMPGEMPAELPAPDAEEIDVTDVDIEEPEEEPAAASLGRGRR